jgi:FixJ family two-component response regulator
MSGNSLVYLLDDDRRALESMRDALVSPDLCVESFSDPELFLRSLRDDVPACLISEVCMHQMTGFELLRRLPYEGASLSIIFASRCEDIATAVKALKYGASDFLAKPINKTSLRYAVRRGVAEAEGKWKKFQSISQAEDKYQALTPREREVLPFVVNGFLNKQTAYELGTSEITVRIHRGHIMRKMGAESLPHLVKLAAVLGIG